MVHRVGIFIASLAAVGVLVVALTLAGFAPGAGHVSGIDAAATQPAESASVQTDPPVQVDTVYVPAPQAAPIITVHRVVTAPGSGEHEGSEQEGGGD